MRHIPTTNRSLLLVLTSAMAACGGETRADHGESNNAATDAASAGAGGGAGASGGTSTGGASETGGVGATGGIGATGGAAETGSRDASSDAASSTMADANADADASCPPGNTPGPNGECYISIRRPFLVGASMRSASSALRADWQDALAATEEEALDEPTRVVLASMWLKDALEEHASVAAFARFTLHLLSLGAPPDFLHRSQQASLDELRHAKACFALASRYGRKPYGPATLRVDDALRNMSLAEVAQINAEEGCVGETLGAILAREQLAVARDPAVVRILRRIAADEARHAELAWRFARWAVLEGDATVRRAIMDAIEGAIAATLGTKVVTYAGVDLQVLHVHGRLTCEQSRAVAVRAIDEVVRPSLRALFDGVAASRPPVVEAIFAR